MFNRKLNDLIFTNILYKASFAKKTNISSNAVVAKRFTFWNTKYWESFQDCFYQT